MTRKEEITKAAREYVSGVILSSPSDVVHFANGAKWADKHPNLESLWHDASEEPQGDRRIFCVDVYDLCWVEKRENIIWLHNNWDEYVVIEGIKMWAYIDDLLPKQFGNSKQVKGGEK